uniref:Uncharacterized protein n=1 Tax=Varanus komodoensis TaxID=61221 RepID=A0A8D2LVH1_VARKO
FPAAAGVPPSCLEPGPGLPPASCAAAPASATASARRRTPSGPRLALGARGAGLCPGPGISPSMITAIVIMALYSVVCVVGLFGNFLVMYVIVR